MIHYRCNFYSQQLKYRTDINVLLPDTRDLDGKAQQPTGRAFPMLVLLHGGADDCHAWMRQTNIERYAKEHGLAVVMPSGHNSFYCDAVYGERFYSFIVDELIPFVRSMLPLTDRREETFIAGASMGGYGSALIALKRPEIASAIGVFSGAIDPHRIEVRLNEIGIRDVRFDLLFGGSDQVEGSDYDLFRLLDLFPADANKFAASIYCGQDDIINFDMSEELHTALSNKGMDSRFVVKEGGHSWEFWDFCAQDFLINLKERGLL